jgi:hypothetical protein
MSAFEDNVAELRVAFLKAIGAVDARYPSTDDDNIVVENIAWCGHTGGELNGSGQEVSTKLEDVVVASWTAGKKRRRNTMAFSRNERSRSHHL